MSAHARAVCAATLAGLLAGCYGLQASRGGGQTEFTGPRSLEAQDIAVPEGYRVEAVASGLTYPVDIAFDADGRAHVVEAGYSYGEDWTTPRLIRLDADGAATTIAEGGRNGPWTGAVFVDGAFHVTEGGTLEGGRLLRVRPGGEGTEVLLGDLPSRGDHHTNGPALGPDGWVYFSIGTFTNSGVVGPDNADMGWLHRHAEGADVPCQDVTLAGANFEAENVLGGGGEAVTTGAFVPFATPTGEGEVIPGRVPCSGAVLRVHPSGGEPELIAWGFRNPFGLAFSPAGRLHVTDNGYDDRGSRPVFGAGDLLWEVEPGTWYGWPDFHGGQPLDGPRYAPPGGSPPPRLLATHPNTPPEPVAVFAVHASADGIDFSRSEAFGHVGQAFVAEFGDMAPDTGNVSAPVGFKVSRVDPSSGVIEDFAVNRGREQGPASAIGGGGLERPVGVRFDPQGAALYVVDFGVMTIGEQGPQPQPETGAVWRIVPDH